MTMDDGATGAADVGARSTGPRRVEAHRARLDPRVILAVASGGALGTITRYAIVQRVGTSGDFPWAVLAVNVVGSFILGVLATLILERRPPSRYARPFAGIGFCGGLTTFSTWMVDATLLLRDAAILTAVTYVVGTLVAGMAAMYAGVVVARVAPPGRGAGW